MNMSSVRKCRICGNLYMLYAMAVHPGDLAVCGSCNRKAEEACAEPRRELPKEDVVKRW